ncbi:phosphoadenosine phosphosulfate sulfurtransferase [Bacteroidia bacterium]|nr:phosphoadenosine phosphosulfate sulfurtransferase [Bacteroidia bacterium]
MNPAIRKNVYELAKERIAYIFSEFKEIYLAFSGGKDSGVMLNLVLDYMRTHSVDRKISVLYVDVEASYSRTIDYIRQMLFENRDLIYPYWICLPLITDNAVSMYEPYWVFWDKSKKDKWVREIPKLDCVIREENNPFDFYRQNMTFEEFVRFFGDWYAKKQGTDKTACLLGLRSDESFTRYHALHRKDKNTYKSKTYSTKISDTTFNFYPIYDWKVEDVWTYNGKFNKPYNSIYDLFYKAAIPLSKMRICEPFGSEQRAGLNLFKILEPETWVKVLDRVSGANFGNIYCNTKVTGTRTVNLPPGHTWRSYCKFLLKTLPEETRKIYLTKFIKFIRYWNRVGSPVSDEDILKLDPKLIINTHTYSKRGRKDRYIVKFRSIPDVLPGMDNKTDFLSWRRLCMAIVKNDIICSSLSFAITKRQIVRQQELIEKYKQML